MGLEHISSPDDGSRNGAVGVREDFLKYEGGAMPKRREIFVLPIQPAYTDTMSEPRDVQMVKRAGT